MVLTLVCFCLRKGFYSFPGTVTIFIQASIAYLQDSNPVAAGLGLAFLILWSRYFTFTLMKMLNGQDAVQQQIWAKAQKFNYSTFLDRDDQSSGWGTWGAGSAPGWGGNEWVQTEAPENYLFFLQSGQRLGQKGAGNLLICNLCVVGSSDQSHWHGPGTRGTDLGSLMPHKSETFCNGIKNGRRILAFEFGL